MTFSKEWYEKYPNFSKGKNNPLYGIRTGKKFEEIYGKEKAEQIRNKMSLNQKGKPKPWLKGKTWEKLYGIEEANIKKEEMSKRVKGKNNPLFGKKRVFSKDWCEAISKGHLGKKRPEHSKKMSGKNNPFYGKKHSEIAKKRLKEFHKWHSKQLWANPEYREKNIRNTLKGLFKRPTSLEKKFIEFNEKYNLPFSYCGNGSLLIGFKNPDFFENNGKKLCIEIYTKVFPKRHENWEINRIAHFAKYSWKCLVIEMDELNDESKLLEKINFFVFGN